MTDKKNISPAVQVGGTYIVEKGKPNQTRKPNNTAVDKQPVSAPKKSKQDKE